MARVRHLGHVVDESSRMLLVDADPHALGELVDDLPGWIMGADQSYPVPDGRARIEGAPN